MSVTVVDLRWYNYSSNGDLFHQLITIPSGFIVQARFGVVNHGSYSLWWHRNERSRATFRSFLQIASWLVLKDGQNISWKWQKILGNGFFGLPMVDKKWQKILGLAKCESSAGGLLEAHDWKIRRKKTSEKHTSLNIRLNFSKKSSLAFCIIYHHP